jgi:hypothetical protein
MFPDRESGNRENGTRPSHHQGHSRPSSAVCTAQTMCASAPNPQRLHRATTTACTRAASCHQIGCPMSIHSPVGVAAAG